MKADGWTNEAFLFPICISNITSDWASQEWAVHEPCTFVHIAVYVHKVCMLVFLCQKAVIGRCFILLGSNSSSWLETFDLGRHCFLEIFLKYWQNFSNSEDMFQKSWVSITSNHMLNIELKKQQWSPHDMKITQWERNHLIF